MLLNSDPELGRGIKGYGRYYWRTFTDGVSGTFFTGAGGTPRDTHEDRATTLWARNFPHTGYAIFLAPSSLRRIPEAQPFNWSEVAGNGLEAGLSNAYYPPQERGLSQTALNWRKRGLNHVFQEFSPDIRKKLLRQK